MEYSILLMQQTIKTKNDYNNNIFYKKFRLQIEL